MIHYAPTLTIINYSVIFIFLVAVALAAMSSLSDSLLTTLFFNFFNIYIIIRHCPGVGAFPRPFCVPNSVALASLTLQVGDWAIH